MKTHKLAEKFPKNHIITDDFGQPSVMVYIKKFYLDEVLDGALHIPHPAFVVNGKELDGIYISKFQNVVEDGRAYSLPGENPAANIDFDGAVHACLAKGKGFHLMSAMEWGAIALWCQKNGWLPYGNNDMGKDIREDRIVARIAYTNEEKTICKTATGTGPVEWSHNRCTDGIYDLNANVWEWVGGLRLVCGQLQVLPNNNGASSRYAQDADSEAWRAIDAATGEFILPNEAHTVKLDFTNDHWTYTGGELTSLRDEIRFCNFADVTADDSVCAKAKELLICLGCIPSSGYKEKEVSLYANNGGAERMAFRGGRWGQGRNAGVFKTCLDDPRSFSAEAVGFRSAYYVE